uniref:ABM domain-containing protein n=1 Tax=Chaetoceros debilis TaxID=122233 RepID=A0A7S3QJ63_9STRA|mmetsp:Transcript_1953/g.2823  ORF Transcript_1953/g.2823 Transcript_1953/m.2823 type:complete len:347 (+) Transcript_1953:29-1069(+)
MVSFTNLLAAFCLLQTVSSFSPTVTSTPSKLSSSLFATVEAETDDGWTSAGLLKRDRYVATNRFAVRKNKGAKFEARWANRKSRLSDLQGFKYFHLMRRVTLNEDGTNTYDEGEKSDESNMGNYVSFTVWDKKSDFSAWRKGDAFKEAHGGTSISAFMSTMISSALILRGAPRPAFYDGLLVQSTVPEDIPETVDGWRNVEADGKINLPEECFIAQNQFFVNGESAAAFEKRWADRESKLKECEGFVAFSMMRRDTGAKGHGVKEMTDSEAAYLSTTIWESRASFDAWRKGTAFSKAHGAKPPSEQSGEDKKNDEKPAKPPMPLWSKPPQPVFYEGTLVISSADGA